MSSTLPSSDAGVVLQGSISDPLDKKQQPVGLAILAHPYGFLGGSLSDPVVSSISRALREQGFRTVRFNSRGVGASQGRGSWTGETEAADYEAVTAASIEAFCQSFPAAKNCKLLLAGYSAGAVYASAVRTTPPGPNFLPTVFYLLVSYPLDKLWALSIFKSGKWNQRLAAIVHDETRRILLVQGTDDQFTTHKNYEAWVGQLTQMAVARDRLQIVAVQGADHFWRTEESLGALMEAVQGFSVD